MRPLTFAGHQNRQLGDDAQRLIAETRQYLDDASEQRRTPPNRCKPKGVTAMQRALITLFAIVALSAGASLALADSTPIGPLPAGPAATIEVQHGELVALALPQRSAGRVWRVARPFEANVLRQVSEANVGSSVVLVFRARTAGQTTVSLALTKGDTSAKALESRRFRIHVR
jgi:hypothetical protein